MSANGGNNAKKTGNATSTGATNAGSGNKSASASTGANASTAANKAAANAENAAAFGLTPAEFKEQKEAWAKLKGQKPPGNPRKTRKLLRRSRSRRIQRKA